MGCETERYAPELVRRWHFEGRERSPISDIAGLGARESDAGLGKDNKPEEALVDGAKRPGIKSPRAGDAEDGGQVESTPEDGPAI